MHFLSFAIVAAAGLADLTAAAPASSGSSKTFAMSRAPAHLARRNLLKEYKRALAKHGHPISARLASVKEADWETVSTMPRKRASSGVGAVENEFENQGNFWISPVVVGGQNIEMQLDTGSSDFWVFSDQQSADQKDGHTIFDPNQSQTFQGGAGDSFNISYGDGAGASGNTVGTDTVNMGGVNVQNQVIGLANDANGDVVTDTTYSGIIGLGFQSINTVQPNPAHTLMENIAQNLPKPIMAADVRSAQQGTYLFGDVDNTAFTGNIQFAPIDSSNGQWEFTTKSFTVGNGKSQSLGKGLTAIMDTGTTLMVVDPKVTDAYYSQVKGAQQDQDSGTFTIPCDADLPDLTLDVGGVPAVIPGSAIIFNPQPPGAQRRMMRRKNKHSNANTCQGAVQPSTGDGPQIYGDAFLIAQYTVFDVGNQQIGVAPHA